MLSAAEAKMLELVERSGCDHTGALAGDMRVVRSTARGILDRLEAKGLVEGIKHDERDLIEGGRIRIYWNLTEAGKTLLPYLASSQPVPGNSGGEEAGLNALGEIAARVGRIRLYLSTKYGALDVERALADADEAAEFFDTVRAALRGSGNSGGVEQEARKLEGEAADERNRATLAATDEEKDQHFGRADRLVEAAQNLRRRASNQPSSPQETDSGLRGAATAMSTTGGEVVSEANWPVVYFVRYRDRRQPKGLVFSETREALGRYPEPEHEHETYVPLSEVRERLTALHNGTAPDRDERYQMAWRAGVAAAKEAIAPFPSDSGKP
jgi:DNA-binding MarR family transcriptional regulator